MSQVGIIPQQQPVIQQPNDDQPHVLRQKQHAPDVHMEKLVV